MTGEKNGLLGGWLFFNLGGEQPCVGPLTGSVHFNWFSSSMFLVSGVMSYAGLFSTSVTC